MWRSNSFLRQLCMHCTIPIRRAERRPGRKAADIEGRGMAAAGRGAELPPLGTDVAGPQRDTRSRGGGGMAFRNKVLHPHLPPCEAVT